MYCNAAQPSHTVGTPQATSFFNHVCRLSVTVEFTAGQLFRPKNIEHGRLNAAMQRSAITRNNVGLIAQETGRAYRRRRRPRSAKRQEILCPSGANIKRSSNLTRATAVIAIYRTVLRCRQKARLSGDLGKQVALYSV